MSPILIAGLALFILLHLVPVYMPGKRQRLIEILGPFPYRVLFGGTVILSLYLVIEGWLRSSPVYLYDSGYLWTYQVVPWLVTAGFILITANFIPGNIRRIIRNPRMAGILLWAVAHLVANGDTRSLVLFGGVAVWSLVAIVGAARRGTPWADTEREPLYRDVLTVIVGILVTSGFIMIHEWMTGASPMP